MRRGRPTWLAPLLVVAAACPNPASTPPRRATPPAPAGDTTATTSARRLARLLHAEARGRLPRAARPVLAAALRRRAAEYAALGAPGAARRDLEQADRLEAGAPDAPGRALRRAVSLALADRALQRGALAEARRRFARLGSPEAGAPPLAAWRRAALEPQPAPLPALATAIVRLHRHGPEQARRLLRIYLQRGGADPAALAAGLVAAREHPQPALARRAFQTLWRQGVAAQRHLACTLFGDADQAPGCAARTGRACAAGPCGVGCLVAQGHLPAALAQATGAERAMVLRALRAFGTRLHRWGVPLPPPRAPWPMPSPRGADAGAAWVVVRQSASETGRRADPAHRVLSLAFTGHLPEALAEARRASALQPEALRLLARLQALSGRRTAAARSLGQLQERSAGGVRFLRDVLHDLGLLGLREAALGIATPLVESLPTDPVLLRALTGLFIRLGDGERVRLLVARWAAHSGDPAAAYRFALIRWAEVLDAVQTAHWARHLLEWTGGRPGPTRRAVARALELVGRTREAALLNAAPAPTDPQAAAWGTVPSGRLDAALTRLALRAAVAPPGRRAALTRLAAHLAVRAGRPARARRILADGWGDDPARFGSPAYRLLAAAARGHRLSRLLPSAILPAERMPPCRPQ